MIRILQFSLAAMLFAVAVGCDEPVAQKVIRPVRAIKIGDAGVISGRSVPGQASAATEVNLAFRVSGPLVQLPVKVGQQVKEGDLLAQIDPTDYRVAVDDASANKDRAERELDAMKVARPEEIRVAESNTNAARSSLAKAQADHDRNIELLKSNAVAPREFDRSKAMLEVAQADLKSAEEQLGLLQAGARPEDIAAQEAEIRSLKAALENAQNQLGYATLQAPFDGSIASTFVENYQTVQANQLIVRLVDLSELEVTVQVPEQTIHMSKYVTEISCVFDAFSEKVFRGKIKEVGTEASQSTRTYPVTIAVQQEHAAEGVVALPGMACKVSAEFSIPEEGLGATIEVPETAILEDGESTYVWLIDETTSTVSRLPVEVGELTPLGVTVSGPVAGQWIATAGVHYLRDGQEVRLLGESGPQ